MMSTRHPLKCKLGSEFLKWEKLNSGVIVDQRAKDGSGNKLFRVHWPLPQCSNEEGKFEFSIHTFGMCGSKTGQSCIEKHQRDALKNAV